MTGEPTQTTPKASHAPVYRLSSESEAAITLCCQLLPTSMN